MSILLQLQPGEKVTATIPMKEIDNEKYLMMATKNGMVKKTRMEEYTNMRKTGLQAILLREDDELIEVKVTDDTEDIFLATKYGLSIRFKESDVRITGRVSYGVIGMKLDPGDQVIGMQMESQANICWWLPKKDMERGPAYQNLRASSGTAADFFAIT